MNIKAIKYVGHGPNPAPWVKMFGKEFPLNVPVMVAEREHMALAQHFMFEDVSGEQAIGAPAQGEPVKRGPGRPRNEDRVQA